MSDKEGEVELRALESLMESLQAMDGTVEDSEGGEEHPPAEFEPFDELGHDWNQVEPAQESHHGPSDAIQQQEGSDQQQQQPHKQLEHRQRKESQDGEQQGEIDLSGLLANVQTLMGGGSLEGLWNVDHDEPGQQQQEDQPKETPEDPQVQEPKPVQEQPQEPQDRDEDVTTQECEPAPEQQRVDASESNNDDSEMFSLPEGLAELTETLKGLPHELGSSCRSLKTLLLTRTRWLHSRRLSMLMLNANRRQILLRVRPRRLSRPINLPALLPKLLLSRSRLLTSSFLFLSRLRLLQRSLLDLPRSQQLPSLRKTTFHWPSPLFLTRYLPLTPRLRQNNLRRIGRRSQKSPNRRLRNFERIVQRIRMLLSRLYPNRLRCNRTRKRNDHKSHRSSRGLRRSPGLRSR